MLMKKTIACSLLSLALVNGPAPAHNTSVRISNTLSACVAVHIRETFIHDNMIVAGTDFRLLNSIGDCGCHSALAEYDSITSVNTAQQVLQNGLINIGKSGSKTLVLASEPALVANRDIQLRVYCAPAL